MNNNVLLKSLALISLLLFASVTIAVPKKKTRKYSPILVTLLESSGAVAPEFRYALEVTLERTTKSHFVYRKETKDGKQIINLKKRISEKTFNNYLSEIDRLGGNQFNKVDLPEEKILGVNYNEFIYKSINRESHFYYLNKEIEKKDHKTKKEIIQLMKRIKP